MLDLTDSDRRVGDSVLIPSKEALCVMKSIEEELMCLERNCFPSPLDERFLTTLGRVWRLFEQYQTKIIGNSGYNISCRAGCSICCYHWVEDVNSFEAEIIADFIKRNYPHKIPAIIIQCKADCSELERLNTLVDLKIKEHYTVSTDEKIDPVDLLLNVFYQMRRPCPLLSDKGYCMIYDVRPITCRIYVSFSDPIRCDPGYINSGAAPTCIIDLSEAANNILDSLHFRFLRFEGVTGLRSLVLKYLS